MKTLLLTMFMMLGLFSSAQFDSTVYTMEWYKSLDEPINFITFPNRDTNKVVEFRIYRGDAESYTVSLQDPLGNVLYMRRAQRESSINLSNLYSGLYYICAQDSEGNRITKRIRLE